MAKHNVSLERLTYAIPGQIRHPLDLAEPSCRMGVVDLTSDVAAIVVVRV